jgi:sterol desaturase/sphingolipid hydroxylase (fatty acid hydroxylase superfamily)
MKARESIVDRMMFPVLLAAPIWAAWSLLERGMGEVWSTVLPIGVLAAIALMLERAHSEFTSRNARDFPVVFEIGHFLLGVELGFGAAMALCEGLHRLGSLHVWPASLPLVAQVLLAVVIYEGASYWQHRWAHRITILWRFHALHHSGAHLNYLRALRFHFVDIAVPSFLGYAPLVLMNAPSRVVTLLSVTISVLGILQHANVRLRTPRALDMLLCTPVIHRQHHALARDESECNYGTTVMLWDHVFGSFRHARSPAGPESIGVEGDTTATTFWPQLFAPFRGA